MSEHKISFVWGADANFGLFSRDLEIADALVHSKEKYGYPENLRINYAKNNYKNVFNIIKKFKSCNFDKIGATLSFQSLSPIVLKNIGRTNDSLLFYQNLLAKYNKDNMRTYSELILALPGETYESFCKGICTLLEMGQHSSLFVYLCELLPHAVMANPAYIKEHKIRSIKVYFKNAHSKANTDDEIHEYSNLVRATDTMNEDEWVASNLFSTCVQAFHALGLLRYFAVYLHYENIAGYFEFYSELSNYLLNSKGRLGELWRDFKSRYDNSLKGNWHYFDEKFGDITWTYEEGMFLQAVYAWDEAIEELLPFLRRFDIPEDIFGDLLAYQKMIIRKPFDKEKEYTFSYNLPAYFEGIFEKNIADLKHEKTLFKINKVSQFTDWSQFARRIVWYGRRKESTLYHRDEYTYN